LALAAACAPAAASGAPPPTTVVITAHWSHWDAGRFTFRTGQRVTFVVRNADPIDHEFIVGDRATQTRHEAGTDAHHDGSVPGEVSVPAEGQVTTTVTFSHPGTLEFACHLPGHYAYGMHGQIVVR
jgi:uncharacterized cupredoxin-like copper-binding protein